MVTPSDTGGLAEASGCVDLVAERRETCDCGDDARSGEYSASADWPADVSRLLFERLAELGLQRRSVLEIGCGYGRLIVGSVIAGAARGTGIDIDADAIEAARTRAREAGVGERVRLADEDGASDALAPHDVVVLDRVICCEPDGELLVRRSVAAADWAYAITVPETRGVRGAWNRVAYAGDAVWSWLTRQERVYLHDVTRLERLIGEAGFRVHRAERLGKWHLGIYLRTEPPPDGFRLSVKSRLRRP
ncbi:MAG TPA: methyltransferase domain-containing protein [Candidatus Limnocylindria bacterium]